MYISELLNHNFEILSEEDEKIDIQAIHVHGTNFGKGIVTRNTQDTKTEKEFRDYIVNNAKDIKTLIKAIKQLDKQLNEPKTIAKEK